MPQEINRWEKQKISQYVENMVNESNIYMTKEKEGRVAGVLKEVKFQGLLQNPEDALDS